ncbi:MAG: DUF427 domain-containing protein [Actinomycetota bacterium]
MAHAGNRTLAHGVAGDMPALRIEPTPKWIRGRTGDRTIVDTKAAQLVWEHEYYPYWYIPVSDVHDDSLSTTMIDELPDHVKIEFGDVERWFEEDEEVFVHPRDPYRRVDAQPSSRHVVVEVDGTVVADSHNPTILYETGLPPRYYLPVADVSMEYLTPTETSTGCPYKGVARYWNVTVDDVTHTDLAWGYDEPLPESAPVKGLICFYNEKVTVIIDGERLESPTTKFS